MVGVFALTVILTMFRISGFVAAFCYTFACTYVLWWLFQSLSASQMPVMDGFECVRRYRAFERSHLPPSHRPLFVVGMSANDDEEGVKEAFAVGMDAFLVKPFEYSKLVEVLVRGGLGRLEVTQPPTRQVTHHSTPLTTPPLTTPPLQTVQAVQTMQAMQAVHAAHTRPQSLSHPTTQSVNPVPSSPLLPFAITKSSAYDEEDERREGGEGGERGNANNIQFGKTASSGLSYHSSEGGVMRG